MVGWVAKVALARRASAALPSVARALASFLVGHDPSASGSLGSSGKFAERGTCAWRHGNLMMLRRATSSAQTAARRAYASGGACTLVQRRLTHRSTTVAHTLRLGGAGRPRALSSLAGSDPLLATEASSEVAQPDDAGMGDALAPDLGEAVSAAAEAAAATPPPKPPPSAGAKHSEGQLLAAYKKQDHETVIEIHAAMVDEGTAPTVATFNCVVGSKAVLSGVADAKALVVEMTEAHPHLKPTVQTYSALLKPYVTSGDAAGAEALVEEMRAAGIKPVLDTFNDLVSLSARRRTLRRPSSSSAACAPRRSARRATRTTDTSTAASARRRPKRRARDRAASRESARAQSERHSPARARAAGLRDAVHDGGRVALPRPPRLRADAAALRAAQPRRGSEAVPQGDLRPRGRAQARCARDANEMAISRSRRRTAEPALHRAGTLR